jgi:GntR family transcriptional regulator
MTLTSDPEVVLNGDMPIHRQIQDQIRGYVVAGLLHPGEPLPTLRAMAVGLGVNPNTVGKAYARLEREGYLSMEDGNGPFVTLPPGTSAPPHNRCQLQRHCLKLLTWAARRGFSSRDVFRALETLAQRRSQS